MIRKAHSIQRSALASALAALIAIIAIAIFTVSGSPSKQVAAQEPDSCVIGGVVVATTQATPGDCQALDALRSTLSVTIWTDPDPCDWYGVKCFESSSGTNGVLSVDLGAKGSGTIPPEIGKFSNIRSLWINDNDLTGTIPPEIGNLTTLSQLRMTNNKLDGQIPASIGALTNLTRLSLERNNLSGEIPAELGSLVNLQQLSLFDNSLSGNVPNIFSTMPGLTVINLQDNELTGPLPEGVGGLEKIEVFDLQNNQLEGSLPATLGVSASGASSLKTLNVAGNNFSGEIPGSLFGSTLREFDVSQNGFTGPVTFPETGLARLDKLDMSGNGLSGSLPPGIFASSYLSYLDVSNNKFVGQIPNTVSQATRLITLSLANNQFSGAIPEGLGTLSILRNFQIGGNTLSGSFPTDFPRTINTLGLMPNGCLEASDPALVSYLAQKGYRAPYGPCALPEGDWGVNKKICAKVTDRIGSLEFQASNPTDSQTSLTVGWSAEGSQGTKRLDLDPQSIGTVALSPVPNGAYTIRVSRNSQLLFVDTGIFDCTDEGSTIIGEPEVTPEPEGPPKMQPAVLTCLGATSRVEVELVNPTTLPQNFSVNIGSISRSATVPASSTKKVTAYGIDDGPITIDATVPNYNISNQSLMINCTQSFVDSTAIETSCMTDGRGIGKGRIDIAIRNTTGNRANYKIEVSNPSSSRVRSKSLLASELWRVTLPNLSDATYDVTLLVSGEPLDSAADLEITCAQMPGNAGVFVATSCLAGRPRADVYVTNNADAATTYVASYGTDSGQKELDLSPGTQGRIVLFSGDGTGVVKVEADTTEIFSQSVSSDPCA